MNLQMIDDFVKGHPDEKHIRSRPGGEFLYGGGDDDVERLCVLVPPHPPLCPTV